MPTNTLYQRCADSLAFARSTYYYERTGRSEERDLEEAAQIAYDENRHLYGQRKIKRVLLRKGWIVSRRKIGQIMKRRGLVSAYTRKKYRVCASKVNDAPVANLLDRKFDDRLPEPNPESTLNNAYLA